MMVTMVDFLLVGFLFAGILITPSTCQPKETKCLMYLDEVREILGSKVPPINESRMTDNYYNISRALFPSVDLPALYVRVTIQFLKDYQNGTKIIDDQKKNLYFTWSKACSYVSVKHISLYAMSVFSLFTIYPQRRESDLVMTVPPFCPNSPYATDDDKTWRYVVSTLEDIIINPKNSDPRLNTACCVIKGHEGDIAECPGLWYFYWFILVSSFCASLSLWVFILQSIIDAMKIPHLTDNRRRVSGAALRMICFTTFIMFLVVFCSVLIQQLIHDHLKRVVKYAYFIAYSILCLVSFAIGLFWSCFKCKMEGKRTYKVGSYFLFPCLFQTVHHILWVVCGIISEPFWAIPIFLLECLFAFSILFAFYLYQKEFVTDSSKDKPLTSNDEMSDRWIKIHLGLCLLSFASVLITVALIAVSNGNAVNSPTAGAIEGVMTLIFFWIVKNSSLDFWSKPAPIQTPPTQNEEWIPLPVINQPNPNDS